MILVCYNCQKEFSSDKSNKKYCSRFCYAEVLRGKYPKSLKGKQGIKSKKRIKKQCIKCGKFFDVWIGRKNTAKYCSKECWNKRNPPILGQCLFCGKDFWDYKMANRQYCSFKCRNFHKRELLKGEKSHFWRGGKTKINQILRSRSKYFDWRNLIFERDNYTCQNCGLKSKKGIRIYLHAHHIKEWSKYPKLRYELSNGKTLCKNCHLFEHFHKF